MGFRLAQRMGWISPEQVNRLGLPLGAESGSMGMSEIALAGVAALRLVRRKRSRSA